MKKILSILIILFCFNSLMFSQCKYYKNEIDEFTKIEMKQTFSKFFREFTGANANIIFDKQGDGYWITINYNIQYPKAMVIGTNDLTYLKLENDSVIQLKPENIVTGKMNTISGITTTQILIIYKVDKSLLTYLANENIYKARITFTDGYREHKVKSKFQQTIKKSIGCILK